MQIPDSSHPCIVLNTSSSTTKASESERPISHSPLSLPIKFERVIFSALRYHNRRFSYYIENIIIVTKSNSVKSAKLNIKRNIKSAHVKNVKWKCLLRIAFICTEVNFVRFSLPLWKRSVKRVHHARWVRKKFRWKRKIRSCLNERNHRTDRHT